MMPLSSEQRRLLQGMGYTLLRRAESSGVGVAEPPPQPTEPQPHKPVSVASTAAAEHPLWSQILLALGGPAERAGLFRVESGPALQFDGPRLGLNLDALRVDADAKRRLWQTLRALRPD